MKWNEKISARFGGLGADQFASDVVEAHTVFLNAYKDTMLRAAENYAFLYGRQNYKYDSVGTIIREDRFKGFRKDALPDFCFDRIGESARRLLAQAVNSFPEIASVVQTQPQTIEPEKIRKAKINDKLLNFFRESKWNLPQLVTLHLFPHAYAGGVAYLMPINKRTGTEFQAYLGEERINSIPGPDGSEQKIEYNDDGTISVGGIDVDPQTLGIEIRREPITEPMFEVIPCFDVSARGRIYQSMSEAIDVTHRTVKTLGELKFMFPDSKEEIEKLASTMPEQTDPPENTSEKYLGDAGFPRVKWGKLSGDSRMVAVYQVFCPPNGEWLDGYTVIVIEMPGDGGSQITLDFEAELPGAGKGQTGIVPIFRFPLSELMINGIIPQSPIEKAKDPQRAYNRIGISMVANAAYNAAPPLLIPEGMQFSNDMSNWADLDKYPIPASKVFYRPSPQNPTAVPTFASMPMSGAVQFGIDFIKESLMSILGVRTNMEGVVPTSASGKSIQTQFTIDQQSLIPALKIWERSAFDAIRAAMRLAQTSYKEGQKFSIPGVNGAETVEWANDIWSDQFDYVMKSKIDEPLTKGAKLQNIAQTVGLIGQIKQLGLENEFPIPRILSLINVGEFTQDRSDPNTDKAEWENEQLAIGNSVMEPLKEENHILHAQIHLDFIGAKEFNSYSPEIKQAAMDHLNITLLKMRALQSAKMLMGSPDMQTGQPVVSGTTPGQDEGEPTTEIPS